MRKGYRELWRRLGRVEKAFLFLAAIFVLLWVSGVSPTWQIITALAGFILGIVCLVRLASRVMRKVIWRLRNRLIVAYLFIAVVPIALILTMAYLAGYVLVGQVAAYFVRTVLADRENSLVRQAGQLVPGGISVPGPGGRGGAPGLRGRGPGGDRFPGAGRGPDRGGGGSIPNGQGRSGGNPLFGP